MITIKLPIQNNIKPDITNYCRVYSSCVRYCYNRFKDNTEESTIISLLKSKRHYFPILDSWFLASAVIDAKIIYKTDNKNSNSIFGGKENWKKYNAGKISKEEFKENRIFPICSIGEKHHFGNRKFKLDIINNNQIIFKDKYKIKIKVQLPKLRNNIKKQLYKLEELSNNRQIPITIRINFKYIAITFDETLVSKEEYKGRDERVLGLDLNPNYIGLSILEFNKDNSFKVLYKQVIDFSQLTKKSSKASEHKDSIYLVNKREFEHYEAVKYIFQLAKRFQVSKIVIEELGEFVKTKCKNVNRLVKGCWNRAKLVSNLKKRCNISNIELIEVNAAYSSFVGNMQYGNASTPDMVASSIEIARRGYRKFEKGWFYPSIKNVENLKNLWKEDLDWSSLSWKKLFEMQKESKLKYRFPLNSNQEVFRLKSFKSNTLLYQFL